MIEWKIKVTDGPDGSAAVTKEHAGFWDCRVAIQLSTSEYLAVYLTAREARAVAKAITESVVGVKEPPALQNGNVVKRRRARILERVAR
jgi:hypothetical protein